MEVATPHLRGLLVAALSTGGRLRDIPVGQRLAAGLDMLLTDSEGATLPHDAFVFGDDAGGPIASIKDRLAHCLREG
jgi:hypothetical protein